MCGLASVRLRTWRMVEREQWTATGIVTCAAMLSVALWAVACGDGAVEPPPDAPRPTTVTVTPASAVLSALGATVQLSVEVRDQNDQVVVGVAVTWASGNASVATVDASGLVTAVANGTTTITATAGSVSGTAAVTAMESPDRATLVAFYHATGGPNWWNSEKWLTDAPLDQWHGIRVDDPHTGRVVEILLQDNNLAGPIPPEIGSLAALTTLDVWRNEVAGPIPPEIGNLTDLRRLNLHSTWLTGGIPPEVGNLTELTVLDLSYSRLTGPIPPELGNLANLQSLSLRFNDLTGQIPPELGDLAKLRSLLLEANKLSGEIPAALANLGNLEALDLASNRLTGAIPAGIGDLSNLRYLSLGLLLRGRRNRLTGSIPPALGNLGNLEFLNLSGNQLTGAIPADLANLGSLEDLNLAFNRLTGAIPVWLGNLSSLARLSLDGNLISGPIPLELGNLDRLWELTLSENDLTGPLPADLANPQRLTLLILDQNRLAGAIPDRFLELNELAVFAFEANAGLCAPGITDFDAWLNGIVDARGPYCNESDAKVLKDLYEASGGRNWTNSDGWLQTPVLDEWHGVSADDLGRVVTLDLTRNGLTGRLPADLGNLAEMTALRIVGNALSGPLPFSLTRLALVELHYADTSLCVPADATFQTWLRGITSHEGTGVVCDGQSELTAQGWYAGPVVSWVDRRLYRSGPLRRPNDSGAHK